MQQQYNTYVGWYVCGEFSTTTVPQWTRGDCYPSVFWTHILCGQITTDDLVQGFHSETTTSTYYDCVDTDASCTYYADGNGECPDVWIYDYNRLDWYEKPGGSSVFAYEISATNLIYHLQNIVNECGKATDFCATGCSNYYYGGSYSIYFQMVPRGVLSAYPKANCQTNVCYNPVSCRNMRQLTEHYVHTYVLVCIVLYNYLLEE